MDSVEDGRKRGRQNQKVKTEREKPIEVSAISEYLPYKLPPILRSATFERHKRFVSL